MKGPVRISLALAVTVLIAAVPVFATLFYAVPLASDFPSLAGALAPLLLACGFVMAQPGIGPLGVLAATYFASSSNIDNVMTYDPSAFLNTSLAILVGIVVAVILFAVFFPDTPEQAVRNFRRQMLSRLGPCAARSDPTIAAYERALYDQLAGTLERLDAEPKLAQECIMGAAAALSIARAVARVRVELKTGHLPPEFANAGSDLLADLSQTCRRPTRVDVVHSAMMASSLRRRALALAAGTDPAARASLSALASACETLRSSLLLPDHLLPEHANVR